MNKENNMMQAGTDDRARLNVSHKGEESIIYVSPPDVPDRHNFLQFH